MLFNKTLWQCFKHFNFDESDPYNYANQLNISERITWKIQALTEMRTLTSAMPMQCSTSWTACQAIDSGYVICKEYIHFAIKYIHFVYWFRRITVLREAFVYLLDFSGSADMVLEQCHRDGNGSLQCPQTCEDLDPEDGELSCKRCGGCWVFFCCF